MLCPPDTFIRTFHSRAAAWGRKRLSSSRSVVSWRPLTGGPVTGEQEADRLLGEKVGTIRIHKLLGEGGMGAVYAGFDERLRREVALKAVRADSLTSNGRARLLSEARVLSRLNHPNICAHL